VLNLFVSVGMEENLVVGFSEGEINSYHILWPYPPTDSTVVFRHGESDFYTTISNAGDHIPDDYVKFANRYVYPTPPPKVDPALVVSSKDDTIRLEIIQPEMAPLTIPSNIYRTENGYVVKAEFDNKHPVFKLNELAMLDIKTGDIQNLGKMYYKLVTAEQLCRVEEPTTTGPTPVVVPHYLKYYAKGEYGEFIFVAFVIENYSYASLIECRIYSPATKSSNVDILNYELQYLPFFEKGAQKGIAKTFRSLNLGSVGGHKFTTGLQKAKRDYEAFFKDEAPAFISQLKAAGLDPGDLDGAAEKAKAMGDSNLASWKGKIQTAMKKLTERKNTYYAYLHKDPKTKQQAKDLDDREKPFFIEKNKLSGILGVVEGSLKALRGMKSLEKKKIAKTTKKSKTIEKLTAGGEKEAPPEKTVTEQPKEETPPPEKSSPKSSPKPTRKAPPPPKPVVEEVKKVAEPKKEEIKKEEPKKEEPKKTEEAKKE
jgi:hypothetical protein